MPRVVLLALGGSAVVWGQSRFVDGSTSAVALCGWLAGLVACVIALDPRTPAPAESHVRSLAPASGWIAWRAIVPAIAALGASVVAWNVQVQRPRDANRWDLVLVWALGVVCALGACWQPDRARGASFGVRARSWWVRRRRDVAAATGLFAVGLVLTLVRLGSLPWTMNGDEGSFALYSVDLLDGRATNPFATGFMGHPLLHNVLQAGSMGTVGRDVFGVRLPSAILGAAAVPLLYLTGLRLTGSRRVGWIAALLLATLPAHLYWSRSALPNGATEFFALATVLLVDLALRRRAAVWFVTLGVVVGAAQYFYFSNRMLVPAVIVALVVDAAWQARQVGLRAVGRFAARLALTAAGFLVVLAPLLGFYRTTPAELNGRYRQISVFTDGWFDRVEANTGRGPARTLWEQVLSSSLLPFRTPAAGFFRPGVPALGWPIAVVGAVGLGIIAARAWSPRWAATTAAILCTVGGMALTVGPAETNRWVMVPPFMCLAAAVGLDAIAGLVERATPRLGRAVGAGAALLTVATAAWNGAWFFADDNRPDVYSDRNTQVAEHLARTVVAIDPEATVYLSAAPVMSYRGFANLVFRTPDVHSVDVAEPWNAAMSPPAITGTTIFVALPERAHELAVVESWFPVGSDESVVVDGTELYRAWVVRPPPATG